MTRKKKRLAGIGFIALVLTAAIGLVLVALRDEIVFFYTPSEIIEEQKAKAGQRFRLGGLVKEESRLEPGKQNKALRFLGRFFDTLKDDKAFKKEIVDKCRG